MIFAFFLTLLAGLSTCIGGLLAMHKSILKRNVLAVALAFSAGAMIFVSLVEILPKAQSSLTATFSNQQASWLVLLAFLIGIILVALIDRLIPAKINPSEQEGLEVSQKNTLSSKEAKLLMRSGLFIALAISLHNFPEGLVTFIAALEDPNLGIVLAIAIAIHNIPEGIAVAAPVFAATKNRSKAFLYTALSGIAEPIGALIGYFVLRSVLSDALFGMVFAAVAGMMIFISIDELLPAAKRYETDKHQTIYGLVFGMALIGASLALFRVS